MLALSVHTEDTDSLRAASLLSVMLTRKEPPWASHVEMPVLSVRHLLEHAHEYLSPREIPEHADCEDVVVVFPLHAPQILPRRAAGCQPPGRYRLSLLPLPPLSGVLVEMEMEC